MRKAEVKECRNRGTYFELQLIIDKKPKPYRIEISYTDAALLKKGVVCEFEGNLEKLTKLFVNGQEITLIQPEKSIKTGTATVEDKRTKYNNGAKPGGKGETKKGELPVDAGNEAKAPYNFIPINKTVVPGLEAPDFDRYHQGRHTGYIKLIIEALTPLYIRDAYTLAQAKNAADAAAQGGKWENPEFFSPGGKPKIPGSSLRGMVRNLVEIVSYSRMEFAENKSFYYRNVAVPGRYQNQMLTGSSSNPNQGLYPTTKAGWLKKENGKYYIYPLEKPQIYRINANVSGSSWKLVMKNEKEEINKELNKFDFYEISFIPAEEKVHPHRGGKIHLRYALIQNNCFKLGHELADKDTKFEKGYLVLSGSMGTNKHMHPVIHCPKDDGKIEINQDLINSYVGDISREPKADLMDMLKKHQDGIPCFYLQDNRGQILSIGHTPLFRLAYDKKVQDHIPEEHRKFKGTDFACAIFGDTDKFAGRVFFEDATLIKDEGMYEELSPKILSTPKPTTVQHYLEQDKTNSIDWNNTPSSDGHKGWIRGYKLYWHRITLPTEEYGWQETDTRKLREFSKQYTKIMPIKEKSVFECRIRFENLKDEELGALLFALDLKSQGCAHKIGMGKPLGLGSIRITPELWISNRRKGEDGSSGRYEKLFNNGEWHLTEEKKGVENFKKQFFKHILEMIRDGEGIPDSITDLWSVPRINEIKAMLYYDSKKMGQAEWLGRTRYMEIERQGVPKEDRNEFKKYRTFVSPMASLNGAGIKYE